MDYIIENNICLATSCINNDIAGIKKALSNGANVNTKCGKIFEIIFKSHYKCAYRGLNFLLKYCNKKNININFNNIHRILNSIYPYDRDFEKKIDNDFLKKIIVLHRNNVINIKNYQFILLHLNIEIIENLIKKYNLYIYSQSQTINYICQKTSLYKFDFFANYMGFNFDYNDAFVSSFIGGNLEIVKYLEKLGKSYKEKLDSIIEIILKNDDIESFRYIFKYNSIPIKEIFFKICCENESFECLYDLKSFCSIDERKKIYNYFENIDFSNKYLIV